MIPSLLEADAKLLATDVPLTQLKGKQPACQKLIRSHCLTKGNGCKL